MNKTENFDVIIVGGGTAGASMANRLSADPARRVLLIEAGRAYEPNAYPDVVRRQDMLLGDQDHGWGYQSEPGHVGHPINLARGKVLGGSSAINGAVAMRATREDHDRWAREYDLPELSFAASLPAYRSLERTSAPDDALHGRSGPFPVHQLGIEEVSDMQRAFIEASVHLGFARVSDFNGPEPFGAGAYPMNTHMGTRLNTGITFLSADVRARSNLTIRSEILLDTVLFEGSRAVGVQLAGGEQIVAGEVVLSAGAYGSPAILLRSGVGPAEQSRALDIPVIEDLPVGKFLRDHPMFNSVWAGNRTKMGLETPPIGALLFARSSLSRDGEHDLHVTAAHFGDPAASPSGAMFILAPALTRPLSTGSIQLRSRNPSDAPVIDLGFLTDDRDLARLVEGVELTRSIAASSPLSDFVHSELYPGPQIRTTADIRAAVRAGLDTYHHPTSTVPMGGRRSQGAVVDAYGRVRGITGLRVVDASIFPDAPSVATNVPTLMLAERIAAAMIQAC